MPTPPALRVGPLLAILLVTPALADPAADPRAASALRAATDCDEAASGDSTARLAWTPAQTAGTQRVAVAVLRDGFERDDVELSDLLPADAAALLWKPKKLRTPHFWRVLTRHGEVWVTSPTARFMPARCRDVLIPNLLPPSGGAPAGKEGPIPPAPGW